MEESKRVKKKKGHPSLILSRSELRECLAGRAVSQFVCIDFESFFDCQPSEIALACIALGEDGSHRHVDSFHALIAPRFDPAMLTRDQSSSASYIESKVTGIPACPPEVSARNDFQQLFAQMMEFVRKYDQLGVLFCKACLMEARSLFFLAEAAGIDEENARLPLLGECQDLVELLVQRELSQNTFNIFVKEFAFDLKACCQFHFNVNKERLERNREPFHCALQDATSFGEVMLAVKQNPERLNAIDAVEKEKDRIRQEERRRKEEEERLLPGLDWGVFRCRGASFKLLIGRSPRSPKEVEDVEKVLGVSMIVTADTDVELLLDSDCGIHQVRSCDTIADLDRERKALLQVLNEGEVVLLCARDVRAVRDLFWAQRLVDERRTVRQVETEWKMCCAAVPVAYDVKFLDPVEFKRYTNELTICPNWNARQGCKGCNLRHVCSCCRSDQHQAFRCKQKKRDE